MLILLRSFVIIVQTDKNEKVRYENAWYESIALSRQGDQSRCIER